MFHIQKTTTHFFVHAKKYLISIFRFFEQHFCDESNKKNRLFQMLKKKLIVRALFLFCLQMSVQQKKKKTIKNECSKRIFTHIHNEQPAKKIQIQTKFAQILYNVYITFLLLFCFALALTYGIFHSDKKTKPTAIYLLRLHSEQTEKNFERFFLHPFYVVLFTQKTKKKKKRHNINNSDKVPKKKKKKKKSFFKVNFKLYKNDLTHFHDSIEAFQ